MPQAVMRSLFKIEHWGGSLIPGYTFEAVSLPAGLSYAAGIWECDVQSVMVPCSSGHLWFRVTSCDDGGVVALAVFGAGSAVVQCDTIDVHGKFRKKGIGLALYRWAACFFDAPVIPTNKRSALSKKFWKDRASIIC
jgi:hypothetical protein